MSTKIPGFKIQGLGRCIMVRNAGNTKVAEDAFQSRFGINDATMFRACTVDWVTDVYEPRNQSNFYGIQNPEVITIVR